MTDLSGIRMKAPAHPGAFLKSEVIEAQGLTVTDAATVLAVSRPALSALLNGRAALSVDMALRFEKAFGLSLETLMRMQSSFDIAAARKREGEIKVSRYLRLNRPYAARTRRSPASSRSSPSARVAATPCRASASS